MAHGYVYALACKVDSAACAGEVNVNAVCTNLAWRPSGARFAAVDLAVAVAYSGVWVAGSGL